MTRPACRENDTLAGCPHSVFWEGNWTPYTEWAWSRTVGCLVVPGLNGVGAPGCLEQRRGHSITSTNSKNPALIPWGYLRELQTGQGVETEAGGSDGWLGPAPGARKYL